MQYDLEDTIAAIASPAGSAVRGMVRLSGPCVIDCLTNFFQPTDSQLELKDFRTPSLIEGTASVLLDGMEKLPCDLFFWPSQRSYTRQPTAELHTLGSPPLLEQLLRTTCNSGARLAEPGEFTLRAFLAGRLDLTQAEAVLGVIDANSSNDFNSALTQLAGGLSQPLTQLREQLLQLLAELEAGLDFVEEDIEFISAEQLQQQLSAAQEIIAEVVTQLTSREEAHDLPRVVLSGPPNAGKSSLFNALVEQYGTSQAHALVSPQSGTTRDFVTARINLRGVACELIDTAGVESVSTAHSIDQLAQDATQQQREQADLVVHCHDTTLENTLPVNNEQTNEIIAFTKSDLLDSPLSCSNSQVSCSSVSPGGLDQLIQLLYKKLADVSRETNNSPLLTATRCSASLRQAEAALNQALALVEVSGGEELIAAEIHGALHALGQVVGTVYTDDILDRIFSQFCIGK